MKKNRQANQRRTASSRILSGVIAMLFVVSLTTSAIGNSQAKGAEPPASQTKPPAAQTTKTTVATPIGTVTGTLTLDGKAIALSYIHAQRREARPSDAERFELKDGEKLEGGVIDLIVANQPLAENMITEIIEDKYRGSNRIIRVQPLIE